MYTAKLYTAQESRRRFVRRRSLRRESEHSVFADADVKFLDDLRSEIGRPALRHLPRRPCGLHEILDVVSEVREVHLQGAEGVGGQTIESRHLSQ